MVGRDRLYSNASTIQNPELIKITDPEHEQDAVIVDPKVAACFTDTHVAQMVGYLNITGLDRALLLNFKNSRLQWKRVLRPREPGEHETPDLHA